MTSNTLQWPAAEQLPRELCRKVNRFYEVATLAAVQMQRAYRKQPLQTQCDYRGGSRASLRELLLARKAFCSEKLDGTNVGIMADGSLLGRRLVIEHSGQVHAETYQHCELAPLRALRQPVAATLDALAAGSAPVRAAVYGELCCNSGLYNYKAAGLAKTWQAFGALFELADENEAHAFVAHAEARGFHCRTDGSTSVRVSNSPAFVDLLRRHSVPVISAEMYASLCELVTARGAWMVGEHGEGLVISLAAAGRTKLVKWKISREAQPAAVSELSELHTRLQAGTDGLAALLDPPIVKLVGQLLTVAIHADSTLVAAKPAPAAKPAKKRNTEAAAVERAIASALTKFDALEATFAVEGKRGIASASERLLAEVLGDAELQLPAQQDQTYALAVKEVENDVKRHVGKAFGDWMKGGVGVGSSASAASAG